MKEKRFQIDGINVVTTVAPRYIGSTILVRYIGFTFYRDGKPLFGDAYIIPLDRINKAGQFRDMFERFRTDLHSQSFMATE
jgi:hypothetical protein